MLHPRDRPTVEKKNRHLALGCQVTGNLPRIRDLVHLPHSATVDCREPSTKTDGEGEILRDEPPHGDNCPRTSQCAYSGSAAQWPLAYQREKEGWEWLTGQKGIHTSHHLSRYRASGETGLGRVDRAWTIRETRWRIGLVVPEVDN